MKAHHVIRTGEQSGRYAINEIQAPPHPGGLESDDLNWVEGKSESEPLGMAFETSATVAGPPPPPNTDTTQTNPAQDTADTGTNWTDWRIYFYGAMGVGLSRLLSKLFE